MLLAADHLCGPGGPPRAVSAEPRTLLPLAGRAVLVSSTAGHHHLYLETPMLWRRYVALLKALGAAGLIEHGFVGASRARGYTSLRRPGLHKTVVAATDPVVGPVQF